MAEFTISIAGVAARVHSLFDSTRDYCRDYLTDAPAVTEIRISPADLEFEQEFLRREALEEGFRVRKFTDPFLDRAAIQRAMAEYLFDRDVLLLHGSALAADGKGYLFAARSGTGKSTHTRLWMAHLGDRAVMVNDDKPFVSVEAAGVFLWGAPWSGKHGLHSNIRVPLAGICLLERGAENRIRPAEPEELLPILESQALIPRGEEKLPRFRRLLEELTRRVPLWRMQCTRDAEAAVLAWQTMAPQSAP